MDSEKRLNMGTFYFRIWIFIVVFFISSPILSQEKLGLPVIGVVTSEAGPAINAVATIYEDGRQIQAIGVGNGGRLNLTFSFDHNYILVLSGDNCFPKRISISTAIPKRVKETDFKFPPFVIEQSLFTEIKGIDKSFSDNAVLRIFYDPGINNFISEVFYNDAQIKKQIENAVWRSQQVGKTAEELSKLSAEELRLMRQEYTQWIKEAGENYGNAKYQDALMGYKAANRLFPGEQFPIDRIAEINDLLLALQITDNLSQIQEEKFKALVQQGDNQFGLKNYEDSKGLYRQALNIKTNDPYALSRIKEIDGILANLKSEEEYNRMIAEGDRLFEIGSLGQAKEQFNLALAKKPGQEYPKTRLKEIEKVLGNLEKAALQQQRYEAALTEGDGYRDKKQYLRARESYNFALSFKPGDPVALARISSVDGLVEQGEVEKNYAASIAEGDKSLNKKDYQAALEAYQAAQKLKPAEAYPPAQIGKINKAINEENQRLSAEQNYLAKIQEGDSTFHAADYMKAKRSYTDALKLKPDEKYPSSRIAEIDKIVADLAARKQTDELYQSKITLADGAFAAKNYTVSKSGYTEASALKPAETYPKQKIAEINKIIETESISQKEYENAVAQGDRLYQNKNMEGASSAYANAKKIKPGENYPDEMISKIKSYLGEQARLSAEQKAADEALRIARKKELDDNYSSLVNQGDALKAGKKYDEAIGKFKSSLGLKPQEPYPAQQIIEINELIRQFAESEKAYSEAIVAADKNFNKEVYPEAKKYYDNALAIKPGELYPAQMIGKIDSIGEARARALAAEAAAEKAKADAEQAALDKNYKTAVDKADAYFKTGQYSESTESYKTALGLKPGETYPKQKIQEIENILANLSKTNEDYQKAIADADKAFRNKIYNDAQTGYATALLSKPGEEYPKTQLLKIDEIVRLLAKAEEIENNYKASVAEGDELFGKQDYLQSVAAYQQALTFKPSEAYPKNQIQAANNKIVETEKLAKEQEALEKLYRDVLAVADNAFNSSDFDKAETGYNNALKIKPDEQYPKGRVAQIGQLREENIRNRYNSLIAEANACFGKEEYQAARSKYNEALKLLTGDEYAKKKMVEIDAIIDALSKAEKDKQELERNYTLAVSQGDKAFGSGSYPTASGYYKQALGLKPNETYPAQRISEIGRIVETAKADEDYKRLLLAADGFFKIKQYPNARAGYADALAVKPEEPYPAKQIKTIDELLKQLETAKMEAERKASDAGKTGGIAIMPGLPTSAGNKDMAAEIKSMYDGFIKNADQSFNEKEYYFARYYYFKALETRPGEVYPTDRINEIRRIIEAGLTDSKEREYRENIDKADAALESGELAIARAYYNRALSVKPIEKYPKGQLELIRKKLDEMLGNKYVGEFKSFISQGDTAFVAQNFSLARFYYLKAIELNPSEQYPKQQIQKIGEALKKGAE